QDERFSYVVLRRGPRPDFRVAVSREYGMAAAAAAAEEQPSGGAGSSSSSSSFEEDFTSSAPLLPRLPPRVVFSQVLLDRAAAAAAGTAATPGAAATAADAVAAVRERGSASSSRTPVAAAREDEGARTVVSQPPPQQQQSRRLPLFSSDPVASPSEGGDEAGRLSSASESATEHSQHPQQQAQRRSSSEGEAAAATRAEPAGTAAGGAGVGGGVGTGPVVAAFARKYPAYGPGLVGRLMVLQDAGVNWAAPPADDAADGQGAAELQSSADPDMLTHDDPRVGRHGPAAPAKESSASSATLRNLGLDSAVAELSLAMVGGAVPDAAGAAENRPMGLREGDATATSNAPDQELAEPEVSGRAAAWSRLDPADVGEEEYAAAEEKLMVRIYGAKVAEAWRASRGDGYGYGGEGGDEGAYMAAAEEGGRSDAEVGGAGSGRSAREADDDDDDDEDAELMDESAVSAFEARVAAASSYSWGRIVRQPRRRGGHTLLDLCVGPQGYYPDEAGAGEGDGEGVAGERGDSSEGRAARAGAEVAEAGDAGEEAADGRLVQQIVAKSARRSWMGRPAYRLARRLAWGDCWPDWYIRTHNTRQLGAAGAGAGQAKAGHMGRGEEGGEEAEEVEDEGSREVQGSRRGRK
ncbi:hypothetical protein Agub_g12143, partial [Astrephomene gubernaculifera]